MRLFKSFEVKWREDLTKSAENSTTKLKQSRAKGQVWDEDQVRANGQVRGKGQVRDTVKAKLERRHKTIATHAVR